MFFEDIPTTIDVYRNQVLLRDIRRYVRRNWGAAVARRIQFTPFSHGKASRLALPVNEPFVAVVDYDAETDTASCFFDTRANYLRITRGL